MKYQGEAYINYHKDGKVVGYVLENGMYREIAKGLNVVTIIASQFWGNPEMVNVESRISRKFYIFRQLDGSIIPVIQYLGPPSVLMNEDVYVHVLPQAEDHITLTSEMWGGTECFNIRRELLLQYEGEWYHYREKQLDFLGKRLSSRIYLDEKEKCLKLIECGDFPNPTNIRLGKRLNEIAFDSGGRHYHFRHYVSYTGNKWREIKPCWLKRVFK